MLLAFLKKILNKEYTRVFIVIGRRTYVLIKVLKLKQ